MKKSKFSEFQIFNMLKQGESGMAVVAMCRKHGISAATFYKWKAKYSGITLLQT